MGNEEKLNKINEMASLRCAAALSSIINTETGVVFSKPIKTSVKEASPFLGSQKPGVGIYLPIRGGVTGSGLFLFSKETSLRLCDLVMKKEFRTMQELSSFDEGILEEVANILLGNYLAVLSNSLKAEVVEGMPEFSSGMFGAILEEVIADFAKGANEALVVKIELTIKLVNMAGYLLLMFKPEEMEVLSNAL